MKVLYAIITAMFCFSGYAQKTYSGFDSIFFKVATEIMVADANKALHISDSLYRNAENDLQKIRATMLKADIYEKNSRYAETIKNVRIAEKLVEQTKNTEWQIRIYGFYTTLYNRIGFLEEAKKYLAKAEVLFDQEKNAKKKAGYLLLASQTKADFAYKEEQYAQVLEFLNQADNYQEKLPDTPISAIYKSTTEELRGRALLHLNEIQKAEIAYYKAYDIIQSISNDENHPWLGYVYTGLAKIALLKQKPEDEVWRLYEKALAVADLNSNIDLRLMLYKDIVDFADTHNNLPLYKEYNEKLLKDKAQLEKYRSEISQLLFVEMTDKNNSYKALNNIYVALGSGIFTAILLGGFCWIRSLRRKKKREEKRFWEIIQILRERLQEKEKQAQELNAVADKSIDPKPAELKMNAETEQRILRKIKAFEDKEAFRNPAVSLSVLSAFCDTNTKYVSALLSKSKGKDFNTYINELRIEYVVRKLKDHKEYRRYKISYLADISGFSSHSKFSSVFKSITKLSPSVFIELLNKKEQK